MPKVKPPYSSAEVAVTLPGKVPRRPRKQSKPRTAVPEQSSQSAGGEAPPDGTAAGASAPFTEEEMAAARDVAEKAEEMAAVREIAAEAEVPAAPSPFPDRSVSRAARNTLISESDGVDNEVSWDLSDVEETEEETQNMVRETQRSKVPPSTSLEARAAEAGAAGGDGADFDRAPEAVRQAVRQASRGRSGNFLPPRSNTVFDRLLHHAEPEQQWLEQLVSSRAKEKLAHRPGTSDSAHAAEVDALLVLASETAMTYHQSVTASGGASASSPLRAGARGAALARDGPGQRGGSAAAARTERSRAAAYCLLFGRFFVTFSPKTGEF